MLYIHTMRTFRIVCAVITTLGVSGCNVTDVTCPADPERVKVSPTSRTMNIGEQFRPTVTAAICGGTRATEFVGRFTSANAAVARVDSIGGTITGVSRGVTYVFARYTRDGSPSGLRDSIRVTVQ